MPISSVTCRDPSCGGRSWYFERQKGWRCELCRRLVHVDDVPDEQRPLFGLPPRGNDWEDDLELDGMMVEAVDDDDTQLATIPLASWDPSAQPPPQAATALGDAAAAAGGAGQGRPAREDVFDHDTAMVGAQTYPQVIRSEVDFDVDTAMPAVPAPEGVFDVDTAMSSGPPPSVGLPVHVPSAPSPAVPDPAEVTPAAPMVSTEADTADVHAVHAAEAAVLEADTAQAEPVAEDRPTTIEPPGTSEDAPTTLEMLPAGVTSASLAAANPGPGLDAEDRPTTLGAEPEPDPEPLPATPTPAPVPAPAPIPAAAAPMRERPADGGWAGNGWATLMLPLVAWALWVPVATTLALVFPDVVGGFDALALTTMLGLTVPATWLSAVAAKGLGFRRACPSCGSVRLRAAERHERLPLVDLPMARVCRDCNGRSTLKPDHPRLVHFADCAPSAGSRWLGAGLGGLMVLIGVGVLVAIGFDLAPWALAALISCVLLTLLAGFPRLPNYGRVHRLFGALLLIVIACESALLAAWFTG